MKFKLKHLMLAAATTALLGGSANAATVLHIAGSTAYRSALTAAIISYLSTNGGGTASSACTVAYTASSAASQANLFKAGQAIFKSTDGTLIVKTNWTGSIAGVVDLVENNTSLKWFPNGEPTTAFVLNGTSTQHGTVAPSTDLSASTDNVGPELAMSDSYFGSVANLVATQGAQGTSDANDINNSSITPDGSGSLANSDRVGIVPFGWWLNNGSSSSNATNISQQVAYLLTQRGNVPVSYLTGSASQKNDFFYLIGRNEDSGTRTAGLVESQGANVTANNTTAFGDTAQQYQATFSSSAQSDSNGLATGGTGSTLTGLQLWPANSPLNTETNLNWNTLGHSGYISGGDVKNVLLSSDSNPTGLNFTFPNPSGTGNVSYKASEEGAANNSFLIGYLGWADGIGVSTTPLLYNGVKLSAANILAGSYSFWTYEHAYSLSASEPNALDVRSNGNSTMANGIVNLVSSTYAPTDGNGNTASANSPTSGAGTDANEDNIVSTFGTAPAGLLIDTANLAKRTIEGGPITLTY